MERRERQKRSEQLNIALTSVEKAELDRYAAFGSRRPSELARIVLQDWIDASRERDGLPPLQPTVTARVPLPQRTLGGNARRTASHWSPDIGSEGHGVSRTHDDQEFGSPFAAGARVKARTVDVASNYPSPFESRGWRGFHWGMSVSSVERILSGEGLGSPARAADESGQPALRAGMLQVAGISLSPTFRFTVAGLWMIEFRCPEAQATITGYEHLRGFFSREYGVAPSPADGQDAIGSPYRERGSVWSFPQNTVEIRFSGSFDRPGNSLRLVFRDPRAGFAGTVA